MWSQLRDERTFPTGPANIATLGGCSQALVALTMRSIFAVLLAACLAGCGTSYQRKFGDADVGYISEPLSGWGTTYSITLSNIVLSRKGTKVFRVSGLPQSVFPSWFVVELQRAKSMRKGASLRSLGEDLDVQIKFVSTDNKPMFTTAVNASQLIASADSPNTYCFEFVPENTHLPSVRDYEIHVLVRSPLKKYHGTGDLRGLIVVCDPKYQKNY